MGGAPQSERANGVSLACENTLMPTANAKSGRGLRALQDASRDSAGREYPPGLGVRAALCRFRADVAQNIVCRPVHLKFISATPALRLFLAHPAIECKTRDRGQGSSTRETPKPPFFAA